MFDNYYLEQVRLLIAVLPSIAKVDNFALKGGTAINLFTREMPRLSVDIDLAWTTTEPRKEALAGITNGLRTVRKDIEHRFDDVSVTEHQDRESTVTKLLVRQGNVDVKIEISPVMRGVLKPVIVKAVNPVVQTEIGYAQVRNLVFEELYAGKLAAALERQHPRDLFDVHLLLRNEGITDSLFRAFLVYAASSSRPIQEILNPNRLPIGDVFEKTFEGMTREDISLRDLKATRETLINSVHGRLDESARTFLQSICTGKPDGRAIGFPSVDSLPAIRFKVMNYQRLRENNPGKLTLERRAIDILFERASERGR